MQTVFADFFEVNMNGKEKVRAKVTIKVIKALDSREIFDRHRKKRKLADWRPNLQAVLIFNL